MNVTDKTPRTICTLYNNCAAASSTAKLVTDGSKVSRGGQKVISRKTHAEWKATNYSGSLRLVHITDIHTDYLYAEV